MKFSTRFGFISQEDGQFKLELFEGIPQSKTPTPVEAARTALFSDEEEARTALADWIASDPIKQIKTKTFYVGHTMLVFTLEGNRGIIINPLDELVEIDTIIPDERMEDALDYLLEELEDGSL